MLVVCWVLDSCFLVNWLTVFQTCLESLLEASLALRLIDVTSLLCLFLQILITNLYNEFFLYFFVCPWRFCYLLSSYLSEWSVLVIHRH